MSGWKAPKLKLQAPKQISNTNPQATLSRKKEGKSRLPSPRHVRLLLRARLVLPISQPPIHDGAVLIAGKRIAAVGRWRELTRSTALRPLDLGEVVLLPGLINAHCHLDYTNMAGEFLPPKVFTDWLKIITATKAGWNYSDYSESWLSGARMLLNTGVTTVADIEAVPELLPEMWEKTPLRVLSFLELLGITARRQPQALIEDAAQRIRSLKSSRCRAGLSPHAPYSTRPELVRLSARSARRHCWRLCTHVAESALEFEMFRHGRGEMFDWLARSSRDMSDCGRRSPVQHLEHCGLLSANLLAVHVNYLAPNDAALLAKHAVSVVHCPRSHAYFRHQPFPLRRLRKAGVNVCLGTDSLASVCKHRRQAIELNMFEEMRLLAKNYNWLSPKSILRMATTNAARALGLERLAGELAPGAYADLITLPFKGKLARVYEAIIDHPSQVSASMIDGQWALAPAQA